MTGELADLYQELIVDHNRSPRNRRAMPAPSRSARGWNPLCGDRVTVHVLLEGDVVKDVSFEGDGCAISTASASMMTQSVKGKSLDEARAIFERFHRMLAGEPDGAGDLGRLEAFAGVRRYPARVKCATLAWHTLKAAIEGGGAEVSTE
jgi:nitrogen fixation NifU-like protein